MATMSTMSPSTVYRPQNVEADIHYWPRGTDHVSSDDVQAADMKLGKKYEGTRRVPITDIRGDEDSYSLEQHGFTVVSLPKKDRSEYEDDWVTSSLYEEYSSVIRELTGADVVVFFNHVQRRAGETIFNPALKDPSKNGPSSYPHVDYSGDDARVSNFINWIKPRLAPAVADKIPTARRTAMFNAWKPIATVQRDALAVGDCTSFGDGDFRPCLSRLPDGSEHGNYVIAPAPEGAQRGHRWCYISQQRPEELLVFREYDSDRSQPGWRCPHTAFRIPGTEHLPARESIECRALALWF